MLRVLEVPETVPALEHTALSTLCGLSTGCQARAPLIGISGTGEGHVAHISGQWIKDNSNPNWRNAKKLQEAISERSSTVVSNSLWPHCLPRCLCPWNSPGKSTGMSCRFLLQGLFLTQRLNLGLLHCRQILYHPSTYNGPNTVPRAVCGLLHVSSLSWDKEDIFMIFIIVLRKQRLSVQGHMFLQSKIMTHTNIKWTHVKNFI